MIGRTNAVTINSIPSVSYPIGDISGYMVDVVEGYTKVNTYIMLILMNDNIDSFTAQYRMAYSDTTRYTTSDGNTYSGSGSSTFTHTWDASKDLDLSADRKLRWIIVDSTSPTVMTYGFWSVANVYHTVIGLYLDNMAIASSGLLTSCFNLQYLKFNRTNGGKISVAQPYNGYFYHTQIMYIDGLDFQYSTDSNVVLIPSNCLIVDMVNINRSVTFDGGQNLCYLPDTMNAILTALSTSGSGKTLTVGSLSLANADSTLVSTVQNNGWTLA